MTDPESREPHIFRLLDSRVRGNDATLGNWIFLVEYWIFSLCPRDSPWAYTWNPVGVLDSRLRGNDGGGLEIGYSLLDIGYSYLVKRIS